MTFWEGFLGGFWTAILVQIAYMVRDEIVLYSVKKLRKKKTKKVIK